MKKYFQVLLQAKLNSWIDNDHFKYIYSPTVFLSAACYKLVLDRAGGMLMVNRTGIEEQIAAGLLAVVVIAVALAYFSETVSWMWRQFW